MLSTAAAPDARLLHMSSVNQTRVVCVCLCACLRSSSEFVFKDRISKHSSSAGCLPPKPWALLHNPHNAVQEGWWCIHYCRGENKKKTEQLWTFPQSPPPPFIPLSLNLLKGKQNRNGTFVSTMESFTVTCRYFWIHTAVPLCLCAGKGKRSRSRFSTEQKARDGRVSVGMREDQDR